MNTNILESQIWLPQPVGKVFPFFANARNLEVLTPAWLRFEILTQGNVSIGAGTLIDYRLRVRGIPIRWQSEITVWEPPHRFVDRQTKGPYRLWVHEHTFVEKDKGTLAGDRVEYAVFGGRLVDRLFVAPDLKRIFQFRREKLLDLFPSEIPASGGSEPSETSSAEKVSGP